MKGGERMKKFLSFLLLFALLLLTLSACADSDDGHGKPTVLGEESSELISALAEYLESRGWNYEIGETSFAIKIREIKEDGAQPLLVEFDPTNFYYVCGYYKNTEEDQGPFYRNVSDYVWLRYEKAEDIRETYRGLTCIAAFRLNPASSVADIRPEKEVPPAFEHFAMVNPVFEKGYNTEIFDGFDEPFIYLNSGDKSRVYYTTIRNLREFRTFDCIRLDGQLFIPVILYHINSDGKRDDRNLEREFDEYYDTLMDIMITGKYTETYAGSVIYYGLFSIEDFAEHVLK